VQSALACSGEAHSIHSQPLISRPEGGFEPLQSVIGDFLEVVHQAVEQPLDVDLVFAAKGKAVHAFCRADIGENGLNIAQMKEWVAAHVKWLDAEIARRADPPRRPKWAPNRGCLRYKWVAATSFHPAKIGERYGTMPFHGRLLRKWYIPMPRRVPLRRK